jgi:hypothetical protein
VTATYLPTSETRVSDILEDLARQHNNGVCGCAQARAICRLLPAEQFGLAWQDFCEAVRNRDDVILGTRHWSEVLDTDAAATHEQACELLTERADEALLVLRTGIRK